VADWAARVSRAASARDLGVEYLTREPAEASQAVLLASLTALVSPFSLFGGPERLSARFFDEIRRDFEQRDVVRMGGWLLSRTELRLCAIGVLRHEEASGASGVFAPQSLRGVTYQWTAPRAAFTVPADAPSIDFQLKSGSPTPQRVTVTLDGEKVDERRVADLQWQRVRYVMRKSDRPFVRLELESSPVWKPGNDFRTIGVAIDRTWSRT
jgi:hypothetical protein